MSASDEMMRLQRLDFPECTREALEHIVTTLVSQEGPAIPGIGGGPETAIGEICQAFIHFRTAQGIKVLNAMQELQMLEMLCDFFKAAPEKHKYRLFQLMFGNRGNEQANTLLNKMVSMALSVSYKSVLDCAAIWMQERTCHSSESLQLTGRLVEDYCLLFPDPSNTFHKLPAISPLFVCNFTTAVTALFTFTSPESVPPLSLLEHVTAWVTQDCTLCCESLRQLPIHGTCSSPIPGLLAWCVLGPVVCSHLLAPPAPFQPPSTSSQSGAGKPRQEPWQNGAGKPGQEPWQNGAGKPGQEAWQSGAGRPSRHTLSRTLTVLSRLHLGVLQSVDFFCRSGSPLTQCLLSVTDAMCLVTQLSTVLKQGRVSGAPQPPPHSLHTGGGGDVAAVVVKKEEGGEGGTVGVAMERLAQVLQVAHMAGCLMVQRGSMAELANMATSHLPSNRLLNMVVAMSGDRQAQGLTHMDTS